MDRYNSLFSAFTSTLTTTISLPHIRILYKRPKLVMLLGRVPRKDDAFIWRGDRL
jgi:hypothetical protein